MNIKRGIVVMLLAWAAPAHADYVCSTHINPASLTAYGDAGSVFASVYTGPNCTGTLVSSLTFCSSNATHSMCAIPANCSGNKWLYTGNQLNQLSAMLEQAILYGQRVVTLSCSSTVGGFIYFRGD